MHCIVMYHGLGLYNCMTDTAEEQMAPLVRFGRPWLLPQDHPVRPQAKAFAGWYDNVQWIKRMRLVTERSLRRMMNRQLAAAFYTWMVRGAVVRVRF